MKKPVFYKSLGFAFKGLIWMFKNERNFQLEVIALFVNIILIFALKLNHLDSILILLICGFVLVSEILNTAIEKLCDFVEPKFHTKIGIIKDIAAGAVLLATIFAVIVGISIYWNYIF
ncbi:diacylglycerol kinase family protein [Halpernia frigidisoli]|uniref:Diacylglycerol kinase (ATP) n=1 Tax=Halpernia frigidisoli TaxID=1125876 RepID=A0A1I3DWG7_9FLAO|nr:diacylglycerol kinase family protein [Halpernia frigidisoli]SFH91076.1 diacylglycerol kinase (ATP) [Halpernia frigidisoli]